MFIDVRDSFLTPDELARVDQEVSNISWPKVFTRADSYMRENNDIANLPVMRELYHKFSTPKFLKEISHKFDVPGVCPDPYMIGAGYSEIKNQGDLKPHIDFNWNDELKLHRVASLIIYLTDHDGGNLVFENYQTVGTFRNRAVLFPHSETIRHFVTPVNGIRRSLRFFYYASKLEAPEGYHRSLYGIRDGKPTDV